MSRTSLVSLALVRSALAPAFQAQGQVWVVDDDGGPGVDYLEIQDAVDAAAEGVAGLPDRTQSARARGAALAVYLYDSLCAGNLAGGGDHGIDDLCGVAAPPSHGGLLVDSFLYAAGSSFEGGRGLGGDVTLGGPGNNGGGGASGGDGLRIEGASTVELLDNSFQAGDAGTNGGFNCLPALDGIPLNGPAHSFAGRSYGLSSGSPARVAQTTHLPFEADAGELTFLGFSTGQLPFFNAPFSGASLLGFAADSLFLGVVPPSGVLDVPLTPGPLGPGVDSFAFYLQSIVVTNQATLVLGAGSQLMLLSPAF